MDFEKLKEIEVLANQKEKEWKTATSLQISSLQDALAQKEKEHGELCAMFQKLKEDFKYNLKLLQDRDRELKQYDESFAKAKAVESAQVAEISDLRIKVANIVDSLEREAQARCEMQRHYRQGLIDQQAKMEAFKSTKDAELEESLSQLGRTKSTHERIEAQLRSEIESQRFELTSELDGALQRKDRESREKEDRMKAEVLASELKCKLLQKELELVKSAQEKQTETLQRCDESGSKLRKKLQEAESDIKDVSAIKNARILELEAKVQNLEAKNLSLTEDYEERRKQLDKDVRLKQANMDSVRKSFLDKEKALEEEIRKLQSRVETSEHETRRALWDKNDLVKEHQVAEDQLRKEIQDLHLRFENETKIRSTSVVTKDVEIQSLKKNSDIMRSQLAKLKEDIEKYKRELDAATQKETLLLQSKVQLKMDWQQRCQEVERKQYAESEGLIESLTKSRDLAVAEVGKLRRQLGMDVENWNDNDAAPTFADQVEDLRDQNEQLKAVIQQMTADMQNFSSSEQGAVAVPRQNLADGGYESGVLPSGSVSPSHVRSLEDELMKIKKEKRMLEDDIGEGGKESQSGDVKLSLHVPALTADASSAHPDVKAHINHLNKLIGSLRASKTDLSAQLQKCQVRLRHNESLICARESEVKGRLGRIRELEYELSSGRRRSEQEMESLRARVSDLQLQLEEARREADEYYKGGIQDNLKLTELGNKVSQMTVDAAVKTPWMGEVVQSGVVKQLQSELTEVRKQLANAKQELILGKVLKNPIKAAALNKQLREKLHLAAEQISMLLEEKSLLLEVGNSLKAELELCEHRKGTVLEQEKSDRGETEKGSGDKKAPNKMRQMEELQYQLTKQELQFAQRLSPRKAMLSQDLETPSATTSSPIDAPTKDSDLRDPAGGEIEPLRYSLSSVGNESMKDVWKILDQDASGLSLPPSSREGSVALRSRVVPKTAHTKNVKSKSQLRPRAKKCSAPKIRNYNIRNDEAEL